MDARASGGPRVELLAVGQDQQRNLFELTESYSQQAHVAILFGQISREQPQNEN
jgi:hypothetical protein